MSRLDLPSLVVVVGSGGVGKTTLAAALGLASADEGTDTLVMTFDPSLRLKDTLGVGEAARDREVEVAVEKRGRLAASLLDARRTFDRLIGKYAPDRAAAERILDNRFYRHLAGGLAGILEYMAVERLFEVSRKKSYARIILDTPPTRQALDFLEAPRRIVDFLESGMLKIALKPWFGKDGRLRPAKALGPLGRRLEHYLDEVVGLELLRDMAEFFQAFAPLYEGFRRRALDVEGLLSSAETRFVLVAGPGEERIPDTLFFARKLEEKGYRLGPLVVNRVHPPPVEDPPATGEGPELMAWLGEHDRRGVEALNGLLSGRAPVVVPLLEEEPADLVSLDRLALRLAAELAAAKRAK